MSNEPTLSENLEMAIEIWENYKKLFAALPEDRKEKVRQYAALVRKLASLDDGVFAINLIDAEIAVAYLSSMLDKPMPEQFELVEPAEPKTQRKVVMSMRTMKPL